MTSNGSANRKERLDLWIAVALAAAAFAWRIPYYDAAVFHSYDEMILYANALAIWQGRVLIFWLNQPYLAPFSEYIAVMLAKLFGHEPPTLALLRFVGALEYAVGVAGFYWFLRPEVDRATALGATAPLAICGGSTLIYSFLPGYPASLLFAAGTVLLVKRFLGGGGARWLVAWAALAGFAAYHFGVTLVMTAWLLVVLVVVAAHRAGRFADAWRDADSRCSTRITIGALALAGFLLAYPVYDFATKQFAMVASRREILLFLAALPIAMAGAFRVWQLIRPTGAAIRLALLCAVVFFLVWQSPGFIYRATAAPRQTAFGMHLRGDVSFYKLRHLHMWPAQARLFFDKVLPTPFIWTSADIQSQFGEPGRFGVRAVISFLLLAAAVGGLVWRCRRWHNVESLTRPDAMLMGSAILMIVLLVPSWQLHDVNSFRLLAIVLPGIYLLALGILPVSRAWRVGGAAVLILLNVFTMRSDAVWARPDDSAARESLRALAQSQHIDVYGGPRSEALAANRALAGAIEVVDLCRDYREALFIEPDDWRPGMRLLARSESASLVIEYAGRWGLRLEKEESKALSEGWQVWVLVETPRGHAPML